MKKLLMIMCLALMSVGAFAEKGDWNIGVDARYYLDSDYKNFGVGAKFQWECLQNFRLETDLAHMFEKDGYQTYEAEVNLQYLLRIGHSGFAVYPIVGAKYRYGRYYTHFHYNNGELVSQSDPKWSGDINCQFGGGLEFPISEKVKINADCKYFAYDDAPEVSVGVAVKF